VCAPLLSCVWLFVTTWTVAHQAPLSMGFPRQEYWSRLPLPSPGESSWPRNQIQSPALQAVSLLTELWGKHFRSPHICLPPICSFQCLGVTVFCLATSLQNYCSLLRFSISPSPHHAHWVPHHWVLLYMCAIHMLLKFWFFLHLLICILLV